MDCFHQLYFLCITHCAEHWGESPFVMSDRALIHIPSLWLHPERDHLSFKIISLRFSLSTFQTGGRYNKTSAWAWEIEHFYIPKAANTGLNFLFCWRSKDCCLWPHKLQDSSGWRKKLVNGRFESLDQQEIWVGRSGPLFVSTLITTAVGPWARPLRALTAAWVRHWDRPLLLVCRMGQMHRTNREDPSSCFTWNSCEMINISSVTWFQVGIKIETRFWHCSRCIISYVIT